MNLFTKLSVSLQAIPETTRAYLYRVAGAAFALLVAYGIIAPGDVPLWTLLLAAVFGLGPSALATANTSRKLPPPPPPEFP